MSAGICKVSPRILAEALHMPEGTTIDNAQWDIHSGGLFLRVSHPDIPATPEGCSMFPVRLMITETVDRSSPDRIARSYEGKWQ